MTVAPLARRLALPFLALSIALGPVAAGLEYHPRPGYAWLHQLTIWAVVLVSGVGFVVGYRRVAAAADERPVRRLLLAGAVPLWGAALAAPPFDSHDLAGYLNCA